MSEQEIEQVLAEVRRENLYGRIYPDPRSRKRRKLLRRLSKTGQVVRVEKTPTHWGGWVAYRNESEPQ